MEFKKHHWYWIIGGIVFYLWWNGSLAAYGLPSAWASPNGVPPTTT